MSLRLVSGQSKNGETKRCLVMDYQKAWIKFAQDQQRPRCDRLRDE